MRKTIAVLFFLLPLISFSQTDVLILQKNDRNIKTYAPGQPIIFETVYQQWFDGTLTDLRNDSVFINGIPFHYNEIKTMRVERTKLNYSADGTLMIIAGVGVLALNTVNGLYRKDKAGTWFSTTGWITSGALIVGGILLKKARIRTFPLGKKYGLHYLELRSYKPPHTDHPPADTH
ncbi:MAG: hypothetical protein Q8918_01965 [Bacteroidota bacterium]|nr:hypothetical protein [Bacteroidota bacterium]MDP4214371.1 hypothetical protein [Bacteroidota bacterium]MDP4248856.1 hypothetical protein [Bacteroidota bacterium]